MTSSPPPAIGLTEELKPCPCCGRIAGYEDTGVGIFVYCGGCGLRTGDWTTRERAAEAWNSRPHVSEPLRGLRPEEAKVKPCMCADPENCREIPEGWEQRCKRMNAPPTDGVALDMQLHKAGERIAALERHIKWLTRKVGNQRRCIIELRALSAGAK